MRPINLIPPEERRGGQAPLRSGPLAYILTGALVAILIGVTALVLVGNQISDREGDIARLEVEDAHQKAKAERLVAYTQFRELSEQRVTTVASLANSRFDWERVMRELALILPNDVWLVNLSATAAPGVDVQSSGGAASLRASAPGPALELSGCAVGQEAVAGFVSALKDIEGVTRVGVQSSGLPEKEEDAEAGGDAESGGEDCRTRNFITKFEVAVAFDAAPIPPTEGAESATPVATTTDEASEEPDSGESEEAE